MLKFWLPFPSELKYRKEWLSDEETMAYNRVWGGTVDFCEEHWDSWYCTWVIDPEGRHFYRYLKNENGTFVGEAAFHREEDTDRWMTDVLIPAAYRKKGYGKEALLMLENAARENGIDCLYDSIAADNTAAIKLFINEGFCEEYRTEEYVMMKKML